MLPCSKEPGLCRAAILELAQGLVEGRPKKRKTPLAAQSGRKRKLSSSGFDTEEDLQLAEQAAHIFEDIAQNTRAESPDVALQLSATTPNRLDPFRHRPDSANTNEVRPFHRKSKERGFQQTNEDHANTVAASRPVASDQELGRSQTVPLHIYIVEKNRQQSKALKRKTRERELEPLGATVPILRRGRNISETDARSVPIADDFDEGSTIFDQLLASDEAYESHTICTSKAGQINNNNLFSTPMAPAPALTPSTLIPASPKTFCQSLTPSKISKPPIPPFKPTFRASLPSPAPSLSPIPIITPFARIPTCFRIGEALRLISSTSSSQFQAIELYAHVVSSARNHGVQSFQFADLFFPQRPPYLHGTCALWTDSELYEQDSASFLSRNEEEDVRNDRRTEGVICRAIIRPAPAPRSVSTQKVKGLLKDFARSPLSGTRMGSNEGPDAGNSAGAQPVEILSIWKCDWDDIGYVRGIVMEESTPPQSTRKD